MPVRVLMVCLGNICRSPLAEGILAGMADPAACEVDSAGTAGYHVGKPPDQRSVRVAAAYGIDISRQRCRQFEVADFDRFDYIFAMDRENLDQIRRMARNRIELKVSAVVGSREIRELRSLVDEVYMDPAIEEYVVSLVDASRHADERGLAIGSLIRYGASPRATIYLTLAAKAHAILQGRGYVTPLDVKSMAPDVLRHRIIVSYEAEAEGKSSDELVEEILDNVEVP